ncbi:MAG: hypothetical protein WAM66_14495 [Acidobacteriaceae bacterium]
MTNNASNKVLWDADSACQPMGLKREYVRIGGDLTVGSLLSQIIYWHRPDKHGKSKLRVLINGQFYVAKTSPEWMDECCLSEAQVKRALRVLKQKGLIEIKLKKFNGTPQNHVRLNETRLEKELTALSSVANQPAQTGKNSPSDSADSSELRHKIWQRIALALRLRLAQKRAGII